MEDSFNISYADAELNVRPVKVEGEIVAYQIYLGTLYFAELYQDYGGDGKSPAVWCSMEEMYPKLLEDLGRQIEAHSAGSKTPKQ